MSKKEPQETTERLIELNILAKFIKTFDGDREQLNPFLTNCKNAINLAAQWQKNILFKLILSKLEGKAQIACAIREFDDWAQLEEFLKTQFGEKKHYAHLLSELQECSQLPSENVNQFSLRLETALARLISEINISIPAKRKAELSGRVAAMEDLALHTFVTGLNPKIATIVRCRNPENLNIAISFAIAEEKISEAISKRNFPSSSSNTNIRRPSRPNTSSYNGNNGRLVCRYCKAVGHVIENCRKREFNNNRFKNFDRQQPSSSGYRPSPRVNFVDETYDDENQSQTDDTQHYDDEVEPQKND